MNGASTRIIGRAVEIGLAAVILGFVNVAAQDHCSDWTQSCASVEIGYEDGEIQVMEPIWWPYKPIVTFEPEVPDSPGLPQETDGTTGQSGSDSGGEGTTSSPPPPPPPAPPPSEPTDEITPGDVTPVIPETPPMSSVPEPISTTLVAVGLAGYGLARRRRSATELSEEEGGAP